MGKGVQIDTSMTLKKGFTRWFCGSTRTSRWALLTESGDKTEKHRGLFHSAATIYP